MKGYDNWKLQGPDDDGYGWWEPTTRQVEDVLEEWCKNPPKWLEKKVIEKCKEIKERLP